MIKEKDIVLKEIPKFPILIGVRIKINYYNDIYKYLYLSKLNIVNISISRYPDSIGTIKNEILKHKQKKLFRIQSKTYYLDDEYIFYKKILKKNNISYDVKLKKNF